MSGNIILLGTSGWSYKEWEGSFYRKGEKRKLRAYTRIFPTVEIDSTWYRYPKAQSWDGYVIHHQTSFSQPNFQNS